MKIKRILATLGLLVSTAHAQKYIEYNMPSEGEDVVGKLTYVTPVNHESLVDLTMRYEMGYDELRWANPGINAWMLSDAKPIVLPTQFILPEGKRSGLVSNIPEMRTYYYLKDSDKVFIYPVGVGRMDWKTPLGSWSITRKQENPNWYPPESIRREHKEMGRGTLPSVVPAGPENPLGTRVLRLALPSYLLHGTNEQTGIGMRVTHGCMRFYPQHIEQLYDIVPTNTMVTFLNQPVKYGIAENDILIEVHPPLEEDNLSTAALKEKAHAQLAEYLKAYPKASVNYDMVNLAVQQQTGIPVIIGQKDTSLSSSTQPKAVNPEIINPSHQSKPQLMSAPINESTSRNSAAPSTASTIAASTNVVAENPDHRAYEDMVADGLDGYISTQPKMVVSTREGAHNPPKKGSENAAKPVFSPYAEPGQNYLQIDEVAFPPSATERAYLEQPKGAPVNSVSRPAATINQ